MKSTLPPSDNNKKGLVHLAAPAVLPVSPGDNLDPGIMIRKAKDNPNELKTTMLTPSNVTHIPTKMAALLLVTLVKMVHSEKRLVVLIVSLVESTDTLILMAKSVNLPMCLACLVMLVAKKVNWLMTKNSKEKILSVLMIGSELPNLSN